MTSTGYGNRHCHRHQRAYFVDRVVAEKNGFLLRRGWGGWCVQSNLTQNTEQGRISWQLEYSFRQAYAIKPPLLTVSVLQDLLTRMTSDDALFQQYVQRNSVSYPQGACTGHCRAIQLCAIEYPDPVRFGACVVRHL